MIKKILFSFALFIIICIPVSAAENKLYFEETDNKLYYDSSQIDKKSFMYHVDMIPGSSYTDELIIENGTNKKYTLYFKIIEKEQSKTADNLLDNINMKIYLDDNLIYDGKAKGLDYNDVGVDLQDSIKLKTFKPGDKSVLKVETTLSTKYTNNKLDDSSYIDWKFYAQYGEEGKVEGGHVEPPKEIVDVPNTHKSNLPVTIISIITCLIGFGIVIYAKKKEN